MQVKGIGIITLPLFIQKKFGKVGYQKWLDALSEEANFIYSDRIDQDKWYELRTMYVEPTLIMCGMFFNRDLNAAWEHGRFSADYTLRGIFNIFLKMSSARFMASMAGIIFPTFYNPGKITIKKSEANHIMLTIDDFPEMYTVIELHICGWIERAMELCGYKEREVKINHSLTKNEDYTEIEIKYKK